MQNRMVLEGCRNEMAPAFSGTGFCSGKDRLIVSLAATRSKIDFPRLCPNALCYRFSGLLYSLAGSLPERIEAGRIPVLPGKIRHHSVKRRLAGAGSCGIVGIDKHGDAPFET